MATDTAVDVVMPQMGVSVSEGTITRWLKKEGEQIEADEPLLEISTDKVDTEVPSPASGVLTQILVQEGATVDVGTKLGQIGGSAGGSAPAAPEPEAPATQEAAQESDAPSSAETPQPVQAVTRHREHRREEPLPVGRRDSDGGADAMGRAAPRRPVSLAEHRGVVLSHAGPEDRGAVDALRCARVDGDGRAIHSRRPSPRSRGRRRLADGDLRRSPQP